MPTRLDPEPLTDIMGCGRLVGVQTPLTTRELDKKAVVSVSDGLKVGTVKDLLIDTTTLAATDLLVSGDSGLGRVPIENIKEIGQDAIMIESSQEVLWATSKASFPGRRAKELLGLPVLDSKGNVVGSVHELDFLDFRITALNVHSGGVLGIGATNKRIPAEEIRGIGPKLITVELFEVPVLEVDVPEA